MFKREPSLIVDRFPRDVPLEQGIGCSLQTLGQVNPVEVHLFFQKQSHFNPHFNSSQSQQHYFLLQPWHRILWQSARSHISGTNSFWLCPNWICLTHYYRNFGNWSLFLGSQPKNYHGVVFFGPYIRVILISAGYPSPTARRVSWHVWHMSYSQNLG